MTESGSSGARFIAARAGRKRNRLLAIALVVVIVALVGGAVFSFTRESDAASDRYRTEVVTENEFVATVSADGRSQPIESVPVFAEKGGTVTRIEVELGDRVDAGDVLYELENPTLHTQTLQAKATLDTQRQLRRQADQALASANQSLGQAEVERVRARQNLEAIRALPATSTPAEGQIDLAERQLAASQRGVQTAAAAVESAKAGIVAARSGVVAAEEAYAQALADEKRLVVESPVTGTVTKLELSVGSTVAAGAGNASSAPSGSPGSTLVIARGEELKVRVAISERDRPRVKVGQAATVTFDSMRGEDVSGTISWLAPEGTSTQGVVSFEADVTLSEQPDWLERGMSASADLVTGEWADALTVSDAAVKVDGSDKYVTVLLPDGSTSRVDITAGLSSGGVTQVLSGLSAGDVVILGSKGTAAGAASSSSVPNPLNPGASF